MRSVHAILYPTIRVSLPLYIMCLLPSHPLPHSIPSPLLVVSVTPASVVGHRLLFSAHDTPHWFDSHTQNTISDNGRLSLPCTKIWSRLGSNEILAPKFWHRCHSAKAPSCTICLDSAQSTGNPCQTSIRQGPAIAKSCHSACWMQALTTPASHSNPNSHKG